MTLELVIYEQNGIENLNLVKHYVRSKYTLSRDTSFKIKDQKSRSLGFTKLGTKCALTHDRMMIVFRPGDNKTRLFHFLTINLQNANRCEYGLRRFS